MAVVIRLQGLKITAGSEDIRKFFTGLRIPDGGVNIIGGELEEAFILFTSDEDARRAMTRSGGYIRGSPVNLLLSSKSEMQKVLEESMRKPEANGRRLYRDDVRRQGVDGRHKLLNENMKLDMRRSDHKDFEKKTDWNNSRNRMTDEASDGSSIYLYLSGMPFTATKEDVLDFFDGLQVDDVIFLRNQNGLISGCGLVKFGTSQDASEGLKRDRKYIGSRYIRVMPSSEKQWVKCGGVVKSEYTSQRRRFSERKQSRSPIRSRSRSPSSEEFFVLYENLSYSVEKRDIRTLLHPVALTDNQIRIFVESKRDRTKSAVVMFKNLKDYCAGLAHHKEMFLQRVVYVSPISKQKMATMVESSDYSKDDRQWSSKSSERSLKSFPESERRYIYVRNLPFDVRKVEIMDFFYGFQLSEDSVILLHDEGGAGLGEALVTFRTEKEAVMAQSLNGQRFLGSELILTSITWAQMQKLDVNLARIPEQNPRGYDVLSSFPNEQMHKVHKDLMTDVSRYAPRNNSTSDQFEKPDTYGLDPHELDPHRYAGPPDQQFNGPTCVKLLNLPSKIRVDEIYDFCYGYRVIPGSVSLQCNISGMPTGTATVVFETYSEAMTALQELNGRPIGTRKITVLFV